MCNAAEHQSLFVIFYGKLACSMHVPLQPAFTNDYDRQEMLSTAHARNWRKVSS